MPELLTYNARNVIKHILDYQRTQMIDAMLPMFEARVVYAGLLGSVAPADYDALFRVGKLFHAQDSHWRGPLRNCQPFNRETTINLTFVGDDTHGVFVVPDATLGAMYLDNWTDRRELVQDAVTVAYAWQDCWAMALWLMEHAASYGELVGLCPWLQTAAQDALKGASPKTFDKETKTCFVKLASATTKDYRPLPFSLVTLAGKITELQAKMVILGEPDRRGDKGGKCIVKWISVTEYGSLHLFPELRDVAALWRNRSF